MLRKHTLIFIILILLLLPVTIMAHPHFIPQNIGKAGAPGSNNSSGSPTDDDDPPPCESGPDCCPITSNPSGSGAPVWAINKINFNIFVTDSPLYYSPAIGPSVNIQLSYNKMVATAGDETFGNKWIFGYQSFLEIDTADNITITMPDGRTDIFASDGQGNYTPSCSSCSHNELIKISENHFELTGLYGTSWVFSAMISGSEKVYISAIRDIHGQELKFGYSNNQLTTITDALNQQTTLQYTNGLVDQITDPFGRTARFTYDGNRNLISLTDMGNYTTQVEYDENHIITALINNGGRTEFLIEGPNYNSGQLLLYPPPGSDIGGNHRITITLPDGNKEEYFYCSVPAYSIYVSPNNYKEYSPSLNNFSDQVPKTIINYVNTINGTRGDISSIIYPNGEMRIYTYDSVSGKRVSKSDAAGNTTRWTFNEMGKVLTETAPNGSVTQYIYEENQIDLSSVIKVGMGTVSQMTYDDKHQIKSITDMAQKTTYFDYNEYGQLTRTIDPASVVTINTYNENHQLSQLSRDGQVISSMTYDTLGRLNTVQSSTGIILTYGYDNLDHLTTITYPDSKQKILEYSSPHSPHLMTSTTDRVGRVFTYSYNKRKQIASSVNPAKGITSYTYDRNNNLTQFTDPNQNTTSFTYESGNRLESKTYADGKSVSYTYYNTGLLHTSTNGRGQTTTRYYDENGNLISIDYQDENTPDVFYEYDDYDRLTQVEDGSGITVFTYDTASRLQTIDGPLENDTITYTYDDLGRTKTVQIQNGETRTYTYDTINRLTNIQAGSSEYIYEYEDAKSPLIKTLTRPNGTTSHYNYDPLKRLLSLSNRDAANAIINASNYTYNDEDLRDSETITGGLPAPVPTETRTDSNINTLNQLTETTNPDNSFAYDDDGNMIQGLTADGYRFNAVYDEANRLKTISHTDNNAVIHLISYTYRYDDFLVRIEKFENSVLVSDTRIVRDGKLVIQDRDENNNVIREYLWGKNLGGGIGGLLQFRQAENNYNYLYDGKGNVISVINSAGMQEAQYKYNAFGKLLAKSGTLEQPFQFSTKRYEPQTGLNYYGYRLYNPSIERWMNRDPLSEKGGINLYAFVQNDPVNMIDPFGLKPSKCQVCQYTAIAVCGVGSAGVALFTGGWGGFGYGIVCSILWTEMCNDICAKSCD